MNKRISCFILIILLFATGCGATVSDTPTGTNPSSSSNPVQSGYNPVSPHFPNIRTMTTDFYVHWEDDPNKRNTYWTWSAKYFDYVLVDDLFRNNLAEYKLRNPNIKIIVYAINWTVGKNNCSTKPSGDIPSVGLFTSFCWDMKEWYNQKPQYNFEDAFLHDNSRCPSPQPKSESCRISFVIWGTERWVLNPGDPGLREYQKDRFRRMADFKYSGYTPDGIFLDEHAGGDMYGWNNERLKAFQVREYFENGQTNWQKFEDDMVTLLEIEKEAAGKPLHINTGDAMNDFNERMIIAAGAVHTENLNTPTRPLDEDVWPWYEKLLNRNVFVEVLGLKARDIPQNYNSPGLYSSAYARYLMNMFISYYMVYPELSKPGKAVFHWGIGGDWSTFPIPLEKRWLSAFNFDIGNPAALRYKYKEGSDPQNKPYRIWARNFEKALVIMRPGIWGYNIYDDTTAVEIQLPTDDSYYFLKDDGTLSGPLTSIKLRNSEGAILLKRSKL